MIILVKLIVGDLIFNIISAYTLKKVSLGALRGSSARSWTHWSVPIFEKLFIGGDLNGHVGSTRVGFDGCMGVLGTGVGTKKGRLS
jgi:hypothetical protein